MARTPPPSPRPACTLPEGWASVARRKPAYVILGEMHGTRQSPEFIGNLACALAAKGQSVLVAVELSTSDNDAIQAAWALPDRDFPAALLKIDWAGRMDGVGSQAMFDLLTSLHVQARQGRPIRVVAFNPDGPQTRRFSAMSGQDPHEAAQAENIRNAAATAHADHVLVLVGNTHARKTPAPNQFVFHPMVMQLAPAAQVVTLNMADAGGTMWNCILRPDRPRPQPGQPISPDALDCSNHPIKAPPGIGQRRPFIHLGALPGQPDDPAYDGIFWLGPVDGSPPKLEH